MAYQVQAGTTRIYTATIQDEAGAAIPGASLTSLTLTLRERTTQQIINSRDEQDVLNANGVTVGSDGLLTWTLSVLDNVHLGLGVVRVETHDARFVWGYGAGQVGRHDIAFEVTA